MLKDNRLEGQQRTYKPDKPSLGGGILCTELQGELLEGCELL